MRIMTASMCDADCVPRVINCGECRSVGQPRVFPDRKRVHVGSRKYGLAFTVPQDAHDSGTTDPIDYFIAKLFEFRRHQCGSFTFLKTQLRMRMNVLIDTFLPGGGFRQPA